MRLTEEQAKTKRCQESFGDSHITPGGWATSGSFTQGGAGYVAHSSPSMCIGSGCMAWRWWDDLADVRGYCGKAGRPTP